MLNDPFKMKRFFAIALATLVCLFCVNVFAASPKKVAVFIEGNISDVQKALINNAVMSRISNNKSFKAFERNSSFVKAVECEHDYQLSGAVPEKQIRQIGERQGADYVIAVVAQLTDDELLDISARLIDLVSGEVLKSCNVSREYDGSSSIKAAANNVAYRLLSKDSK